MDSACYSALTKELNSEYLTENLKESNLAYWRQCWKELNSECWKEVFLHNRRRSEQTKNPQPFAAGECTPAFQQEDIRQRSTDDFQRYQWHLEYEPRNLLMLFD